MRYRYRQTSRVLQFLDGGHCYLRAFKDAGGKITFDRFPPQVTVKVLEIISRWAKVKPRLTKTEREL